MKLIYENNLYQVTPIEFTSLEEKVKFVCKMKNTNVLFIDSELNEPKLYIAGKYETDKVNINVSFFGSKDEILKKLIQFRKDDINNEYSWPVSIEDQMENITKNGLYYIHTILNKSTECNYKQQKNLILNIETL